MSFRPRSLRSILLPLLVTVALLAIPTASVMDLYGVISTNLAWSSSAGQDGVKLCYVPRRR
ncbi:hypothetical protein ABT061_30625 [Streptosporangium sp. NPDC002544]|uniref:hypothetical protein n=1 Tax=Streptosporangium sp. NPDC002544 TaxID=3154538 RepID=UPI00331B6394